VVVLVRGVQPARGQEVARISDESQLVYTRVERFRTTEGTWISLDVSPDGGTIIFDLLGDLYTLPIAGGQARRLASGPAFDQQPRYSPDGRHIVFVSDRSGSDNLWIADRDGRHSRQLSRLHGHANGAVASPAWSPDGRTIVASQHIGAARRGAVASAQAGRWLLAAYDARTSSMRWISDTAGERMRPVMGPAFGPRADIVYASVDGFSPGWSWEAVPNWRIVRLEMGTGRIEPQMWLSVGRAGMRPALSRDGRYLVYATSAGSHPGLRLRDLRNDRERWLVRDELDDPPFYPSADSRDLVPGYCFTPDSRFVVVSYGGRIHRIDVATGLSSVIPFVADVEQKVRAPSLHQFRLPDTAVRTRSVSYPSLSPDGRRVAFSALDRIWVMELPHDGQSLHPPRRLTTDTAGEFFPSWSPDGQWIVYSTWIDGTGGDLRRIPAGLDPGGGFRSPERLTTDGAVYSHTAVSPDGDRIVAIRTPRPPGGVLTWTGEHSPPTIVWLPAAGGRPQVISSQEAEGKVWFHDDQPGDQLYFTTDPAHVYLGMTSRRWDGTDARMAVRTLGAEDSEEPYHVVGVMSPNGERGLITRKYTLFEVTPSKDGQDTLNLDQARTRPFGSIEGAAQRWGTALSPWVSWSLDGKRVVLGQGGTLYLGEVPPQGWITFRQIDVPLPIPADVPGGTLVLRGARLITMRGREVIERGELVVRNNRIVSVGKIGSTPTPPGARVIDVTAKTIIPGYVDVHDHLALPRGVHPQQCWQCLSRLAYGITASRDPNSPWDVFAYRERERAGDLISPRIFSTGMAYLGSDPAISTLEDARDFVRPYAQYFATETFKVYSDPSTGRRAWQLLAMAAKEQGLNPTVHTWGLAVALKAVADGFSGVEHTSQTRFYGDVATLIGRTGVVQVPTFGAAILGANNYMLRHNGPLWESAKMRQFAPPSVRATVCDICTTTAFFGPPELGNLTPLLSGAAQVVRSHGRVGVGSHGDIPGIGFHWELWLYAMGGMPNLEILRAATIVGATAIGHAPDLGSLEPGKLADLQVLDLNPLESIRYTTSIRYVMKNGRLYRAEDLTQVFPRNTPLAPFYLWGRDSSSHAGRSGGA
jgi:Tol biopolymer transport system component